jgi:hypothetical protein
VLLAGRRRRPRPVLRHVRRRLGPDSPSTIRLPSPASTPPSAGSPRPSRWPEGTRRALLRVLDGSAGGSGWPSVPRNRGRSRR